MGKLYGLKVGHPMPFRRTIRTNQPYQLVFQPGEPLELSEVELDGLQKEIAARLIVPWEQSERDHRGRRRPLRVMPKASDGAGDPEQEQDEPSDELEDVGTAAAGDAVAADEGDAVAATGSGPAAGRKGRRRR